MRRGRGRCLPGVPLTSSAIMSHAWLRGVPVSTKSLQSVTAGRACTAVHGISSWSCLAAGLRADPPPRLDLNRAPGQPLRPALNWPLFCRCCAAVRDMNVPAVQADFYSMLSQHGKRLCCSSYVAAFPRTHARTHVLSARTRWPLLTGEHRGLGTVVRIEV